MHYRGGRTLPEENKVTDVEAIEEISEDSQAPIVPEDTPYFHFDLISAVRAAEAGLSSTQTSARSSMHKPPVPSVTSEASSSASASAV